MNRPDEISRLTAAAREQAIAARHDLNSGTSITPAVMRLYVTLHQLQAAHRARVGIPERRMA